MNVVNELITYSTNIITNTGLLFGICLIIIESFIPILPLGVIVALITNAYGIFIGITISWIANCIGCYLVYTLFCYISETKINKFLSKYKPKLKIEEKYKFNNIPLANLTAIIALPFTPSFLINILSALSKMDKKKYLLALLIGKFFMISFWAYIGKSFIESMSDIKTIITIIIMLLLSYVISKIVSKKLKIE